MKTNNSNINIVQKIRTIRDALNIELINMTLEQEKAFLKESLEKLKAEKKARQLSAVVVATGN